VSVVSSGLVEPDNVVFAINEIYSYILFFGTFKHATLYTERFEFYLCFNNFFAVRSEIQSL